MSTASEMLNLLKTRRSVRAYKHDAVLEAMLDQVLEAGTYAPSAMGRQSPTLIAITTPEYREREIFDSEAGKALLREWGLPETLRGVGSIALGYGAVPASQPKPRKEGYIVKV